MQKFDTKVINKIRKDLDDGWILQYSGWYRKLPEIIQEVKDRHLPPASTAKILNSIIKYCLRLEERGMKDSFLHYEYNPKQQHSLGCLKCLGVSWIAPDSLISHETKCHVCGGLATSHRPSPTHKFCMICLKWWDCPTGVNQKRCKECDRNYQLKYKYSLSSDDYQKMYDGIQGNCPICKKHFLRLVVDHDHKTGAIRGLLCSQCNKGIGHLQDSVDNMKSAIVYLEQHRGNNG